MRLPDRWCDPFDLVDVDCRSTQRPGDTGVVSALVARAVALHGDRHVLVVSAHGAVVDDDARDRDLRTHRCLDLRAGVAERQVAHEVHAELVRVGHLRTHRKRNAVPEVRGLAPADVPVRHRRLVERHDLIARVAGIVGHHAVGVIDGPVDFVDDPIGIDRRFVGSQERRPLGQPLGLRGGDVGGQCGIRLAPVVTDGCFHFIDHQFERESGVAHESDIDAVVLVDVLDVDVRVDHELAGWNVDPEVRARQAGAYAEYRVRGSQPLEHAFRSGPVRRTERQRMVVGERALALHGGDDRDLRQFRERSQFFRGLGVEHSLSGPDDGIAGVEQRLHGVPDV